LLRLSVTLAKEARDQIYSEEISSGGFQLTENNQTFVLQRPKPLVAASVGPYGATLANGDEYTGDYALTYEQLMDFHRPRMRALLSAEPDLLIFETIPSQFEAKALTQVLGEFKGHIGAKAMLALSCLDGERISHGEKINEVVREFEENPQIIAVGVNCVFPTFVESLLRTARKGWSGVLLCYPNSGELWKPGNFWIKQDDSISQKGSLNVSIQKWKDCGASVFGGCCRTNADFIHNLTLQLRFQDISKPKPQ